MRLDSPLGSYRRRVRRALAYAIAFHVLLFVFFPRFPAPQRVDAAPAPADTVFFIPAPPDDYIPIDPRPAPESPDGPGPIVETDDPTPVPPPSPTPAPNGPAIPGIRPPAGHVPYYSVEALPEITSWEPPRYPALARAAGIEGTVSVRVLVDAQGRVSEAEVISSDVTPSMEQAAVAAARKCRFLPARQQHVAVPAYVVIPYHFRLQH